MPDPFQVVRDFEAALAEFCGSRFACAVDTGTAALFLCCRYLRVGEVLLPKRTYLSVANSVIHAGGRVTFIDQEWQGEYSLDPYPIIDSACRFRRGMHQPDTYRCLSFQNRKHLKMGRGGAILSDDPEADRWFRLARFHGRHERPLLDDQPEFVGWHAYMEPERAARGLYLLSQFGDDQPPDLSFDYPDLSRHEMYHEHSD